MRKLNLGILILLSFAIGYVARTAISTAWSKPTEPAFMVGVNGVDVHRFADVYEGGVIHCYVAHGYGTGQEISCVKR
jgi:hypothetical protein